MRHLATAIETCHIVADKLFSHMHDFALKVLNYHSVCQDEDVETDHPSGLYWLHRLSRSEASYML